MEKSSICYDKAEEALKDFVEIVGAQTRVVIYVPPEIYEKLRHPTTVSKATRYDERGISKNAIIMDNVTIIGDQDLAEAATALDLDGSEV